MYRSIPITRLTGHDADVEEKVYEQPSASPLHASTFIYIIKLKSRWLNNFQANLTKTTQCDPATGNH